jgi:hypothetical protein
MISKMAFALLMLTPIFSAHADPASGNLYLMNEVIETTAQLQPGEKYLWYGAIPADVIAHGAIGCMAEGPLLGIGLAAVNAVHVVPSVVLAEDWRLQAEAMVRADHLVTALTQIPGNKVTGLLSLSGDSKEGSGLFTNKIHKKSIYFFNTVERLPENFTVNLPTADGSTKLVSFSRVENPQDVTFTFSLSTPNSNGTPWTVSLLELSKGLRLPADRQKEWMTDYHEDKKHGRIDLQMHISGRAIDLGTFTEGQGVEAFLGHAFFGRVSYYARHFLLHSADEGESRKLRLKFHDLQNQMELQPYIL